MSEVETVVSPSASSRTDVGAWRDAVIRGEFPAPARADRWQPLRAGVVNLWEYDVAEVWFGDGRLQLQGANESGKSTLMTLTTLIMLAGDLSAHNIDTLGESGKKFRYYVQPTKDPSDRREMTAAKQRGWAWVEYGQLTEDGAAFFTTLLFAESRRADAKLKHRWCTLHGDRRVRAGLTLLNAGFVVDPGHLVDTPGWTEHPTATAYRKELARTLFDADQSWLDQVIRLLRVVRTPKIGDRLDLQFLTDAFRQALPPLAEDEIHQLADGWEQLERLRTERDTTDQALKAVAEFDRRSWRPWADAVIRAAADPVVAATSALDGVTRKERTAKATVDELDRKVREIEGERENEHHARTSAEAEREALRERQEFRDAIAALSNAKVLAENAQAAEERAGRSEERADAAAKGTKTAEEQLQRARNSFADANANVDDAAEQVAARGEPAGLVDVITLSLPNRDTARLHQAGVRRQDAARQGLRLLKEQESAEKELEAAAREVSAARETEAKATAAADAAGRRLDLAITTVGERLRQWAAGLIEGIRPEPRLLEQWARGVAGIAEAEQPVPVLAASVGHDHLTPTRRPLEGRQAFIDRALDENGEARRAKAVELAEAEAETDPRPAPPNRWCQRKRPGGVTDLGAPFWRLVEVDVNLSPERLDVLEAALEAAGLLQAWVTPDGTYLAKRDGRDTVWTTAAMGATAIGAMGGTLRAVLRSADEAGPLTGVVDRLLRSVSYGPDLPAPASAAEVSIAADGRWRHGALSGSAAPMPKGAGLLGAAARATARTKLIAELSAQLAELAEIDGRLRDDLIGVRRLLDGLDHAAELLPVDSTVVGTVLELRHSEAVAAAAADRLREVDYAERTARARMDTAIAAVAAHAADHGLPRTRDDVDSLLVLLTNYLGAVKHLESTMKLLSPLEEAVEAAKGAVTERQETLRQANEDAEGDRRAAETASAKAKGAKAALSAEGKTLLARVESLGRELKGHDDKINKLDKRVRLLDAEKGKAEARLERIEESRAEAERLRQAAVERWFACMDTGLPRLRELADPSARHVTAALESARTARSRIAPRNWPDDGQAMTQRVQHLWSHMTEAIARLRTVLEPLAGRTVHTALPGERGEAFPGAVEIMVDGSGAAQPPPVAAETLSALLDRLVTDYDEELTRTINELLGSTFIEHLRDRLIDAERLRREINAKLEKNPTSTTGLTLRLVTESVAEERDAGEVLKALERGFALLPEVTQEQVRSFLSRRVNDAQQAARAAGDPDWRSRLIEVLDYRRWFDLRLEHRAAPTGDNERDRWRKLDRDNHAALSGGAKVVTLLQPFVAALHAMYDQSGVGPRMMWLDEAFDGVDPENRAIMLRLLTSCDLDWMIAGPGPIANVATVPMAAMYEVRRAPRPDPGVSLELAVWTGNELIHLATPDPADLADSWRQGKREADPQGDLFSLADKRDDVT